MGTIEERIASMKYLLNELLKEMDSPVGAMNFGVRVRNLTEQLNNLANAVDAFSVIPVEIYFPGVNVPLRPQIRYSENETIEEAIVSWKNHGIWSFKTSRMRVRTDSIPDLLIDVRTPMKAVAKYRGPLHVEVEA